MRCPALSGLSKPRSPSTGFAPGRACRCDGVAHGMSAQGQRHRARVRPSEDSEDESHQEDVRWVGHAEQLRCEGRLVSGVCEGASDTVHISRLEVSVGASRCRRRVVAPQGVRCEEP
eukprot:scaffold102999_cov59-Phaeocystis_antarctica.AAC.1